MNTIICNFIAKMILIIFDFIKYVGKLKTNKSLESIFNY